jgi:CMP/dCMP kinase
MKRRSIVVNGDLGSGKSTVSLEIASRLGLRRLSVGDLYREMARSRGMSALELNLHAELDEAVDGYVDQLQREIAEAGEQLVVDSRLAWHFFSDAFKVHLVTDPLVAAERVLSRPLSEVETYSSAEEAAESLRSRSESERVRFLRRYGVDKTRLRNYDLICDTTRAGPQETVDYIVAAYRGSLGGEILAHSPPLLLLDPARIYPSESIYELRGACESGLPPIDGQPALRELEPVDIGYADSRFYLVDGHRRLSTAIRGGARLIVGRLRAERDEEVVGGLTAARYFESEVSLSMVYDWEEAHRTKLRLPPHLAALAEGVTAAPNGQ